MVLQALEAIKEAENKASAIKDSIAEQMKAYEKEKETQFLNQTQTLEENNSVKLQEYRDRLQASYEQTSHKGKEDAQKEIDQMKQHFENHKDELISFIVDKVRENYGS